MSPLPTLFVSHGSPMFALEPGIAGRELRALTDALPRPEVIVIASPHWMAPLVSVTAAPRPETIHDFGGFPQALFDQQYPAPGAPQVARSLAVELKSPATGGALGVDEGEWGLDHGTWSVLKPMFPKAQIPVMQLSMDYSRAPSEHYALGQQLKALRERGVLIVGSGNVVHNLRLTRRGTAANEAYDWATEFDTVVQEQIKKGQLGALQDFQKLGAVAKQAHPTHEHYLPLLYAAGAVLPSEMPRFFNTGYQSASISMRSVLWG